MKGIVRRKRTALPSWGVLNRSHEVRGWTAWTSERKKVVIQWTIDEPNSSLSCHQVQPAPFDLPMIQP